VIFIYRSILLFYGCAICFASLFNKKAKAWCAGRKNYFDRLKKTYRRKGKTFWIHCASLGEFEQGRPVIELLKKKNPGISIVLTFFSPSGYEVRKDYKEADYVLYLPLDTPRNAKLFLEIIRPDIVVFVKYEFWYFFLMALKEREIPVFLISAIFRHDQWFFKNCAGRFRKLLDVYTQIFVQDDDSKQLLKKHGIQNVQVAGDTRFDRVLTIAGARKKISVAENFKTDHLTIVAGSTWKEDEEYLFKYVNQRIRPFKWIVAPHEIYQGHLKWIAGRLQVPFVFYSEAEQKGYAKADVDVLVIDNIGMLSSLYAYADVAYIGGGFGNGIHNILEAAVFGVPVVFGPNYRKFREACELLSLKGAFSYKKEDELTRLLSEFYDNEPFRKQAGQICQKFVYNSGGSAEIIVNNLLMI